MTDVVALLFAVGAVSWSVALFREVHSGAARP